MIRYLPLIVGIAPLIGVTMAYWLNVRADVLPSCIPYIDGCTSISATGRYMPGSMVFRAVLLPQAAFLTVLWWFSVEWLREVSPTSRASKAILLFGFTGAVALIVYVSYLGTKEPFYEFLRRFGIYLYFLGTALAQILLTLAMTGSRLRNTMLLVISLPFVLGVTNLLLKLIMDDSNAIENSIEWISALLMQGWFVLLYVAWRGSGLTVTVRTDSSNAR